MDHYRLLNIARNASKKEIKEAYFKLAKKLHPDVTGNDPKKVELFKKISDAHAVLSDTNQRRQYDAQLSVHNFAGRPTSAESMHPYAADEAHPDLQPRKMYGINEEVWLAHHYGVEIRRKSWMPPRQYGMNIVEERMRQEEERIRSHQRNYRLNSTAGYFLRREERIKRRSEEERKRRETLVQTKDQLEEENGCVVS